MDALAKTAAENRISDVWASAVEASVTKKLSRSRGVVAWLSEGLWLDSKSLGKVPGRQVAKAAAGKPLGQGHVWVWNGARWMCVRCAK